MGGQSGTVKGRELRSTRGGKASRVWNLWVGGGGARRGLVIVEKVTRIVLGLSALSRATAAKDAPIASRLNSRAYRSCLEREGLSVAGMGEGGHGQHQEWGLEQQRAGCHERRDRPSVTIFLFAFWTSCQHLIFDFYTF